MNNKKVIMAKTNLTNIVDCSSIFHYEVFNDIEIEQYQLEGSNNHILEINTSTNSEYKRDINVSFEFDEKGKYSSFVEIKTNDYIVKDSFNLDAFHLYGPFDIVALQMLYEDPNETYMLAHLCNLTSANLIPYVIKKEKSVDFDSEEKKIEVLEHTLDLLFTVETAF